MPTASIPTLSRWSSEVATRFIRQRDEGNRKSNEELRIKELLDAEAPKFWDILRVTLMAMCHELTAEPGMKDGLIYDDSKPDVLSISSPLVITEGRHRGIKVQFTRHSREISVHGDIKASWIVDLYPNSTSVACLKGQARNAEPVDVQFIAAGLLEGLLGISKVGCIV